ncbi:MAG: hypothetical protein ACPGRZ_11860 [Alphaproteobacteria bacterium]
MNSEPAGDAATDAPEYWEIGPDDAPVLVENAEAVLPYLPYFLTGWNIRWAGASIDGEPEIRIDERGDGTFRVISRGPGGADFSFDNPYDAANGLAGGLISVHVARDDRSICLHAGAAKIDDGLVIVIGDSFAGKSSVALHLAVLGHRFFGDDQIAVTLGSDAMGTCLGLMPKVRLPLPEDCGDAFREFVEGYSSMQSDDMAYLKLWEGEAADFGETALISALVFLDRGDAGEAALEPASRSDLVRNMVSTAFAPHIGSAELLSGLTELADSTASYHLRFSSSRDAAGLLSREFRNTRPAP